MIDKVSRKLVLLLVILVGLTTSGCLSTDPEPTAEVTLTNGIWQTHITIEQETKSVYQGKQLYEAIDAAIKSLGPGTINIRNSGDLNLRLYPQANQTLDFHNNTIGGQQGIHVYHQDNVTIRNLHMNGNPLHTLVFNGSSHIHLHNIWLEFKGDAGGIRIDEDRKENGGNPVPTKGLTVTGKMLIEGTRGHGFETYSVDDIRIEQIVTRNTAGCGVLLNDSANVRIGLVDAYRADRTGGYAGFRVANTGGPDIIVDKVIARECGRGVFLLSSSQGIVIHEVDINGTHNEGIYIEGAQNVSINGGTVTGYQKYGVRLRGGSHTKDETRNVTIQNLTIRDSRNNNQAVGLIEEASGTTDNRFLNNDLRGSSRNPDRELMVGRSSSNIILEGNITTRGN